MPDLLLELFSEEIPARMQAKAADDLKKLVTDALVARGVVYEGASGYATPRRLALTVHGLPARQPDTREERKGPRVGAPDGAIQGFLKAAGLASLDQARIESDPKKGEFYVAVVEKSGRAVPELIAEIVPEVVKTFPWPKSMRWGSGSLRWVRPLHSIICTFGPETEDPEVVRFEIEGVSVGDTTHGHRFMAPAEIKVKRFDDYVAKLEAAKVVLDPARRRDIILTDARNLAFAQGLELVEDDAVLHEAAGLVEWPVVLMGSFDPAFLSVPDEAIQATIRANQKCFVVRDPKTGRLANRFILISNIEAKDGGSAIIAGNERVIRARLSDAKFFWETDQKPLPGYEDEGKPLDQRLAKIVASNVVFHEKLGTQGERINRIASLAKALAPVAGAEAADAERAAKLAKADLATEMVGEFPELQGLMGRYYATAQGENASIAAALEDHYRPKGAGDSVPTDPVAICVALADKLDTLVGFWTIDEKPTSSKDPYALRRAALGTIRILIENKIDIPLLETLVHPLRFVQVHINTAKQREIQAEKAKSNTDNSVELADLFKNYEELANRLRHNAPAQPDELNILGDLLSFFADRLKGQLRDQGVRHDLVDAAFAVGGQDNLLLIARRVEVLGRFLGTEDGKALVAGAKRAANILRIEEKKDGEGAFSGGADASRLAEPEEQALHAALQMAQHGVADAVAANNFEAAMTALAQLRQPVDAFFDKILVNAEDANLRLNRLKLLHEIRAATLSVADFSKIEG